MKKSLIYFLLVIFCTLFYFSFQCYFWIHPFNHTAVKKNIEYLSSDSFKGRLAGTLENDEAAVYIKNSFKDNGLMPYNGNYIQSFDTIYPRKTSGNPYLSITDKNGLIIKEYKYGIDYKEDLLNFKENKLSFNKQDKITISKEYLQIQKDDNFFLFYSPENNTLNFRSSFINSSPHSMYIMVTKNTLKELQTYIKDNNTINCFIPFEARKTTLNNIVAYIKGKSPNSPPIILSAHFDHVGTDLSGKVYNGALDNASGTAFLMEISRYIKSLGTPYRNIIFVGFNAEEFGCLGSKAFVDEYKDSIKGSKAFNFDMIGSSKDTPIYIMGGKKDTKDTPLIKETSSICLKDGINFNYLFEDASDHEYFRKQGIDAVTLCDADSSRIHTPNDKYSFISTDSIDRCFKITSNEIVKYGFNNNLLLMYYKETIFISLLGIIVCYRFLSRHDVNWWL